MQKTAQNLLESDLYDGYQVATDVLNGPMTVLDILNVLEADQPPVLRWGKEMNVTTSLLSATKNPPQIWLLWRINIMYSYTSWTLYESCLRPVCLTPQCSNGQLPDEVFVRRY